jgi:hypothetical protein
LSRVEESKKHEYEKLPAIISPAINRKEGESPPSFPENPFLGNAYWFFM